MAAAPGERDASAIQEVLDLRAEAIRGRDRDAFMATIARDSPAFVRRQARLFRWMEGVEFADYRLRVRFDQYGDLVRPSDVRRYPGADVAIPVTEERYRIAGFDPEPAVEEIFFTFVERGDEWLIAEDTDLDDIRMLSARHLWDFGPVEEIRSPHFLLLRHPCGRPPGCASIPDGFVSLAEQALARVDRYWRAPWHGRVVMLVPTDEAELARMLQATFDVGGFVAFAYSTIDVSHDLDYTGHRIIVNPPAFAGRSDESTLGVLAHELLHVATRDSSGPFVPVFLDEGFAELVGREGDASVLAYFDSQVAAGVFDGTLPQDFEFTTGTGEDIFRSYREAHSAVRYFVSAYGLGDLARFYRRVGAVDVRPGTTRHAVDRALRQTVGPGFAAFERAWASSIGR